MKKMCFLAIFYMANLCFGVLPDTLTVDIQDVTNNGQPDRLVLTKRSMRSAGFRLFTWSQVTGYQELTGDNIPQVRTYRGYVEADPDTQVNAYIDPAGMMAVNFSDGRHHDLRLEDIAVDTTGLPEGTARPDTGNIEIPRTIDRVSPTPRGFIIPKHTMCKIRTGVDIANDFYIAKGSVDAAVALVEQRINDTDQFYARDMGLAWEITDMVVRVDGEPPAWKDFWDGSDGITPQDFNSKLKFKAPTGGLSTGRIYSADIDFPNTHTATLGSTSPYSRSLGHEVAHGFGVGHFSSWEDTIGGSESAIGTGTVQKMLEDFNLASEISAPAVIYNGPLAPHAMEDSINTKQNQAIEINVLENDYDGNGEAISIAAFEATSDSNGTVSMLPNGNLLYTPAADFLGTDRFKYHVSDSTGLTNRNGLVKIYVRNEGLATHLVLDEVSGTIVKDLGQYQAHGQLTDDINPLETATTAGVIGTAIENTVESKRASVISDMGDPLDESLSASLWVKFNQLPTGDRAIISKGGAVISARVDSIRGGWAISVNDGYFYFACKLQADLEYTIQVADLQLNTPVATGQWYHLAMTMDRENKVLRAWVNNQEITTTVNGTTIPDGIIESFYPLTLFNCSNDPSSLPAIIDDVRIYNNVLTATDVSDLYINTTDYIATSAPEPADLSTKATVTDTLGWTPGNPTAYDFDVYLGTDYTTVLNATTASAEYQGLQSTTTFTPASLSAETNYFWRIDTIDGSTVLTGPVWQFYTGGANIEVAKADNFDTVDTSANSVSAPISLNDFSAEADSYGTVKIVNSTDSSQLGATNVPVNQGSSDYSIIGNAIQITAPTSYTDDTVNDPWADNLTGNLASSGAVINFGTDADIKLNNIQFDYQKISSKFYRILVRYSTDNGATWSNIDRNGDGLENESDIVERNVYNSSEKVSHYTLDMPVAIAGVDAVKIITWATTVDYNQVVLIDNLLIESSLNPIAHDDLFTISSDSVNILKVLANDNFNDDFTTVESATQPTNGTVSINATDITYAPNSGFTGTDSFTYTINDGTGGTDSATVTINVVSQTYNETFTSVDTTAIASTPIALPMFTLESNTHGTVNVVDITNSSQLATTDVAVNPKASSYSITGNAVQIIAPATYTDDSTNDPFTDNLTQNLANSGAVFNFGENADISLDSFTFDYQKISSKYYRLLVRYTTDNGTTWSNIDHNGDGLENDSDVRFVNRSNTGESVDHYTTVADLGLKGVDAVQIVVWSNLADYAMTILVDNVTLAVKEGEVVAVNTAPVAVADSATVDEDSSVVVAVLANDTDADLDTLSISAVTQGTNGTVTTDGTTLTYTPSVNYNGADSFNYTITDGELTATATVNVSVNAINDVPVAIADTAVVDEDNSIVINVLANDSDIDSAISVDAVTQATNGTVTTDGTTVTYIPNTNYNGADSFTYTITDGELTDTATVNVTVTAVNDAPVAAADTATVNEDSSVIIAVLNNDSDIDSAISINTVTQGTNGTVTTNGITITYIPAINYNGTDTFTYTITDGLLTATETVTVTINAVNDAPIAIADTAEVDEDSSVVVAVLANDSDIDSAISVNAVTQGTNGTVTTNGTNVTYTPLANWSGNDSFTYTISDGAVTDTATVNVIVNAVNDAPIAIADTATVDENSSIVIAALDNDSDIDSAMSINSVTQGTNGAVTTNGITINYIPNIGWDGIDSFTYTVTDGELTSTASVTVTVNNVWTTVPDVTGVTQATAEADLVSAQLTVGAITQINNEAVPAGNVISQSVSAGNSVVLNTTVDLVISLGPSISMPKLYSTVVPAVTTDQWVRVTTPDTYTSMVVVATPRVVDNTNVSVVTRIANVNINSFDLIVQRVDDGSGTFTAVDVNVVVAEEGVYTVAECGVDMEVGRLNSTVTTSKRNYNTEALNASNNYTAPVVLGQVISFNDSRWSSFWACGSKNRDIPTASDLNIGKSVGEDPDNVRNNETLGYIIIESGVHTVDGVTFECGVGADSVQGLDDAPGYSYTLSGGLTSATVAVLSAAAFDDSDCGAPVLYGANPVNAGSLVMAIQEDQKADSERSHATEQVAYIVFE